MLSLISSSFFFYSGVAIVRAFVTLVLGRRTEPGYLNSPGRESAVLLPL